MDKGTYTGRRADFSSYAASCFNPFLFRIADALSGCGASALGLLTGIPPANFAVKNPEKHYFDQFMLRCLRRHGFRVLRLTQCNLSQKNTAGVTARHVLLLSQLFRKNEATWIVLFNNLCYHNFDVYSLETLSFINKPLLSAYVVFHQKWQLQQTVHPGPPRKRLSKGRQFLLTDLGLQPKSLHRHEVSSL